MAPLEGAELTWAQFQEVEPEAARQYQSLIERSWYDEGPFNPEYFDAVFAQGYWRAHYYMPGEEFMGDLGDEFWINGRWFHEDEDAFPPELFDKLVMGED